MSDTARSLLASAVAAALGLGFVGGVGVWLGFPARGALTAGAVVGLAVGLLLLGASRRAATFHATEGHATEGHATEGSTHAGPDPEEARHDG